MGSGIAPVSGLCYRGGSVMTGKKTVALTGGSGTMGFQGFLELYSHK